MAASSLSASALTLKKTQLWTTWGTMRQSTWSISMPKVMVALSGCSTTKQTCLLPQKIVSSRGQHLVTRSDLRGRHGVLLA